MLGLGGWFAAALVALIALPSVPIDAAPVIVLGMGLPVAIAVYCGWRELDRAGNAKAGLVAAIGGALIGGALGFACATAMLAVVTTLLGAVAGANLALIARDVAAAARLRARFPRAQRPMATVASGGG